MKVIERTDATLEDGGKYTWKHMENGEHRRRMVFPGGLSVSSTELAHYEVGNGRLPWQGGHFHKGKTEVYFLISGWVAFVWLSGDGAEWDVLDEPGETFTFLPDFQHNVLLGPDAHIGTAIFGEPVGNPDRKGNDWWPAAEDFDEITFVAKSEAVNFLRDHDLL